MPLCPSNMSAPARPGLVHPEKGWIICQTRMTMSRWASWRAYRHLGLVAVLGLIFVLLFRMAAKVLLPVCRASYGVEMLSAR